MRTGSLRQLTAGALALTLSLAACGRLPRQSTPAPAAGAAVVADRMYFGRNIPGGGTVSDSAWKVFLAEVVTPRFPEGFTVLRSEGQWRGADGAIDREDGFVFEVHHRRGLPPDSVFAAIGAEYCRRFRQEAVLHVRTAAEQWLYQRVPR